MEEKLTENLVQDLGTLFRFGGARLTDWELLDRFVARGHLAEAAFEEIVRRYGPMVLGVCRRMLADTHTAEDAFQATFLILAFRANAIHHRNSLGPWLYGVASRLSRRTRVRVRSRPEISCPLPEVIASEASPDRTDLRSVLDEELGRLPEKYRRPLVLCYLEGLSQEEAARALGWSKGSVSGRLARAKEVLRPRLARRGLVPAACLLTLEAGPGAEAAAHAVPTSLIDATTRAAMAIVLGLAENGAVTGTAMSLARGGLRSILIGRLKAAALLLVMGTLGGAIATGYTRDPEDKPAEREGLVPAVGRPKDRALPREARLRLGTSRLRHEGEVVRAFFSPDGRTLATTGTDGELRFWDPKTGMAAPGPNVRRVSIVPPAAAYSPDGQFMAVGHGDGTVELWDVAANQERFHLAKVHKGMVLVIAFAPDGLTFASSSSEDSCVRIWDVATGKERRVLPFTSDSVSLGHLAFSPDGDYLALGLEARIGGSGSTICIWNRNGESDPIVVRCDHERSLAGFVFTKDGQALISGGDELRKVKDDLGRERRGLKDLWTHITCWDLGTGQKLWEKERAVALQFGGLALTQDGATLVSAHQDRLLVWDLANWQVTSRVMRTIPIDPDDLGGGATGVAISPDASTLALLRNDHRIRLMDLVSGRSMLTPIGCHDGSVLSTAFTPDGRTLATSGADGKVRLWNVDDGTPRGPFDWDLRGWSRAVCVSPDGRSIAAVGEYFDTEVPWGRGLVRLWDVSSGRLRLELKFDHRATLVRFSPDGRRIAVSTWNSEAQLGYLGGHGGTPDDTVRVFDVGTGRVLAELRGHKGRILALAFAPDGRSLVSASEDMSFRFWDLDSGKQTRQLAITGHVRNGQRKIQAPPCITHAAFAPDLKWALTSGQSDDRLIVWDLVSGAALRTIRAENDEGAIVAISPDGRWFGSVRTHQMSENKRLRIWEMTSGREVRSLDLEGKLVLSLEFAPDGKSLATGMADTTAIIWDLSMLDAREPRDGGRP